jgi:hypothetical protein
MRVAWLIARHRWPGVDYVGLAAESSGASLVGFFVIESTASSHCKRWRVAGFCAGGRIIESVYHVVG